MKPIDYTLGHRLGGWQEEEMARNPDIEKRYLDLLKQEKIIPEGMNADGFVFFSPSANQGTIEACFANAVDVSLESVELNEKPKFIIADAFGEEMPRHLVEPRTGEIKVFKVFESGFLPDKQEISNMGKYKNVGWFKVASLAESSALPDNSVDVIWDRLGALWHEQDDRAKWLSVQSTKKLNELLDEYRRILKPDGRILLDASEDTKGAKCSTYDYLSGNFVPQVSGGSQDGLAYVLNWKELGWNTRLIGSGDSRLFELTPITAETNN